MRSAAEIAGEWGGVSPRQLKAFARKLGAYHKLGRTLLLSEGMAMAAGHFLFGWP